MPVLVLLGAAAAAATTTYLVPLIISCVGGGITIIVTFFSTRAFYKKQDQKNEEREKLKQEQIRRDNILRKEVEKIAKETGFDIQSLLKLSKQQQIQLKITIKEFMRNIESSDTATKDLTSLATQIQAATANATFEASKLHTELEKIKIELSKVYEKLSSTEQALASKEKELQLTINMFTELSEKIASHGLLEKLNKLAELDQKNDKPSNQSSKTLPQKDELIALKESNRNLSRTIKSLNQIIDELENKLTNSNKLEKLQIQEIQKLITDNKLLTDTIKNLTESMEIDNRLLSKLTVDSKVLDDSERRTGAYESVHKDSSTEATNKFASAVEFRNKSNQKTENLTQTTAHQLRIFK